MRILKNLVGHAEYSLTPTITWKNQKLLEPDSVLKVSAIHIWFPAGFRASIQLFVRGTRILPSTLGPSAIENTDGNYLTGDGVWFKVDNIQLELERGDTVELRWKTPDTQNSWKVGVFFEVVDTGSKHGYDKGLRNLAEQASMAGE